MWLLAWVVATGLAGEPQCPPGLESCYHGFNEARFGNALSALEASGVDSAGRDSDDSTAAAEWSAADRAQLCNATNWAQHDLCFTHCPLRLVISEPPRFRMSTCVWDNSFEPYIASAHIDLHHPLNNVTMDLIGVGGFNESLRTACLESDYFGGDYEGKIAVLARGTCYFAKKFANARGAGAAAGVMMNTRQDNSISDQLLGMVGPADVDTAMPSVAVSRQHGEILFSALTEVARTGETLRGRFIMSCTRPDIPPNAPDYDSCPHPLLLAQKVCGADSIHNLCQICPLELLFDGVQVCLWGNQLLPRSNHSFMQHSVALPHHSSSLVVATELSGGGCVAADFAQLSGKVLLIPKHDICTPFHSARMAEQHGVAAFIMLTPASHKNAVKVEGPSEFVTIPVHTVGPQESKLILDHARQKGQHESGVGYFLGNATFMIGTKRMFEGGSVVTEAPPTHKTFKVGVDVDELKKKSFGLTAPAVVATVVLVVETLVLLALLVKNFRTPASAAAPRTNDKKELCERISIPLALATTALSLSLFLTIATTSFSLAYYAGKRSTETAVQDGQAGIDSTYATAVANVEVISDRLKNLVIERVLDALDTLIDNSEIRLQAVRGLYMNFEGTWESFDSSYPAFVDVAHAWPDYIMNVFTIQGFFASKIMKTDDRPDDVRQDSVVGSVAETNLGWPYGVNTYFYDDNKHINYWASYSIQDYNATKVLGGAPGDPLVVTRGKEEGFMHWHITDYTFPQVGEDFDAIQHPASVFTPLYTRAGHYMGTIEARKSVDSFGQIISAAINDVALENMTVVIYNWEDGSVYGTNAHVGLRVVGLVLKVGWRLMYRLHTFDDHPAVRVNALGHYLNSTNSLSAHGEFEQSDWEANEHVQIFDIQVAEGAFENNVANIITDPNSEHSIVDKSGNAWDVEMRGERSVDFVFDPILQKTVLYFGGTSLLYIYKNLTTRIPSVQRTQLSAEGEPWRSSVSFYKDTIEMNDTRNSVCISHTTYQGAEDEENGSTSCLLREPFTINNYTISIRFKPHQVYAGAVTPDMPKLFSETLVGETNVRLFANGQLFLNVVSYGCATQPIPGGFPANQWSTVTIKADDYCSVYVNGVLAQRAHFASTYRASYFGTPYHIGQNFRGSLEYIKAYNVNLTDTEIMYLHEYGVFKRDVPEKRFYVEAKRLEKNSRMRAGVAWAVAAMIPVADIMRVVDGQNRELREVLAVQEENTQAELRQSSTEAVLIILATMLLAVLVFLTFNHILTLPFSEISVRLTQAADLQIDTLPDTNSVIKELQTIHAATYVMLKNLQEYRSFLPEVLLHRRHTPDAMPENAPGNAEDSKATHAAIVFTDISGSTQLWEDCHDGMRAALHIHNAVIRACITSHSGYEVKTIGDAFMVAFGELDVAVTFALQAQLGLAAAVWPEDLLQQTQQSAGDMSHGVRVRMGVNYGAVSVEFNEVVGRCDYFGGTVNRSARLEALCIGGGVALCDDILQQASPDVIDTAIVVSLGPRSLKGIAGKVRVSVLIPKSLKRRADYVERAVRDGAYVPNPLAPSSRPSFEEAPQSDSGSDPGDNRRHAAWGNGAQSRVAELVHIEGATIAHLELACSAVPTSSGVSKPPSPSEEAAHVNSNFVRVVSCLERSDGQILTILGSSVVSGWNVTKACPSHVEGTLRFLGLLTKATGSPVRCGASTGRIMTGCVGTAGQRFVTAVGGCVRHATALFSHADVVGTEVLYMAAPSPAIQTLCTQHFMRPIGTHVILGTTCLVHEVCTPRLREWCDNKFDSLFSANRQKTVDDLVFLSNDVNDVTRESCWSGDYLRAFEKSDWLRLNRMAKIDHVIRYAVKLMKEREEGVEEL